MGSNVFNLSLLGAAVLFTVVAWLTHSLVYSLLLFISLSVMFIFFNFCLHYYLVYKLFHQSDFLFFVTWACEHGG